jgi:hypothetical protein
VQLGWDQELPRDATRRFINKPVLCIRIGFSAEADPTFYLNADPNTESQNNALHPDPGQTLPLIEGEFLNEKYSYNVSEIYISHKAYLRRYKSLFERLDIMFICQFLQISLLLDPGPFSHPDPGEPNYCGSMPIRIHNIN